MQKAPKLKPILFFLFLLLSFSACKQQEKGTATQRGEQSPAIVEVPDEMEIEEEISVVLDEAVMRKKEKTGAVMRGAPLPEEGGEDIPPNQPEHNTDEYDKIVENPFQTPKDAPLSTFSIDVDGASYSNVRNSVKNNRLPYADAVRIEEFVNYFTYDYANPKGEHPFSVNTEVGLAPWNAKHKLVHIGLQGKMLDYEELAPSNLVFLLDVSGSMEAENKLPLLKKSLGILLDNLGDRDRVAIAVYASASGLVLPATPATEKDKIMDALNKLNAGGSTAGGEGIELAYKVAEENLIPDGNNRVILATDGDFNVGTSSTSELVRMIEEKRKKGIYLTICGFGMGNYKDGRMEQISNAGNGNYFYIDNVNEARKVFEKEMRATLFTIAKDVKIQVEFNPKQVQAYRLIGYENRMLKSEDFNDDTKDAGELGAGHTVTALYEIIPVGVESEFLKDVDGLKYQNTGTTEAADSEELMTVKLRYKRPDEDKSRLLSTVIKNKKTALDKTSDNFRFSAAVAELGLLLRKSEFKAEANFPQIISLAKAAKGKDEENYRAEFIQLAEACEVLMKE